MTTLQAGSPPCVVRRTYTFALDIAAAKSIIVYPIRDETEPVGGRNQPVLTKHSLILVVECRAKGTASTRPDQEIDELYKWVVATLAGKSYSNGLYHIIEEGPTVFSIDQADHAYCLAAVQMIVRYQTRVNDPDTRA